MPMLAQTSPLSRAGRIADTLEDGLHETALYNHGRKADPCQQNAHLPRPPTITLAGIEYMDGWQGWVS